MKVYNLAFLLLLIATLGCQPLDETQNTSEILNPNRFDTAMQAFVESNRSRLLKDFVPVELNKYQYHNYFETERVVFVPKLDLSFELKKYSPIAGKEYMLVYVHNDTINELVSFSDFNVIRDAAYSAEIKRNEFKIDSTKLVLDISINKLKERLSLSDDGRFISIVDEIMSCAGFDRLNINSSYDKGIYKASVNSLLENNDISGSCRNEIAQNLTLLDSTMNPSPIIYTNGLLLLVMHVSPGDEHITTEIRNGKCLYN